MDELKNFKENINLAEFAAFQFGYKAKNRTELFGSDSLEMIHPESGDVISVYRQRGSGEYKFWSPYNDKGSIIDFIQNRDTSKNLGEVRKMLRNYANLPKPKIESYSMVPTKASREDILLTHRKLQPLTDRTFLHSRGITNETLDSNTFVNTIKNNAIKLSDGSTFVNTVFPIYNDKEGLVGIEQRNVNYKCSIGGSDKVLGVWVSNYDKSKPLFAIDVTESPIDAISKYQLGNDKELNILYISTNGPLSTPQGELIERLIEKHHPTELRLSFDNDLGGQRILIDSYNKIRIEDKFKAGNKLFDKFQNLMNCEVSSHLPIKTSGEVIFNIASKSKDEGILNVNELKGLVNSINAKFKDVNVEGEPFAVAVKELSDMHSKVTIGFKNTRDNWERMSELIADIKQNDLVKVQLSRGKDFNEDLMQSLNAKSNSPELNIG